MDGLHTIRIGIADDHHLIRNGIKEMLSNEFDADIKFEAKDGNILLEQLKLNEIDLLFLDISMPGKDGMEVLRIIAKKEKRPKVIVLTFFEDGSLFAKLAEFKVEGIILKTDHPKEMTSIISNVIEGEIQYSKSVMKLLVNHMCQMSESITGIDKIYLKLANRDKKILKLICQQKCAKEIGAMMNISTRTVETRKYSLMKNLGVTSQIGLVLFAIQNRIYEVYGRSQKN